MRQKAINPKAKYFTNDSGKLRATDYPQAEYGHSATGRNMVDTWDLGFTSPQHKATVFEIEK